MCSSDVGLLPWIKTIAACSRGNQNTVQLNPRTYLGYDEAFDNEYLYQVKKKCLVIMYKLG